MLKRLLPRLAETHGRIDETDHTVGLGKIAPELSGVGVDVLREQTMAVATGQQGLEQGPRLLAPAQGGQGIDIPEGADGECVLGDAEVVLFQVAKDEIAAAEPLLDRGDGAGKTRVK